MLSAGSDSFVLVEVILTAKQNMGWGVGEIRGEVAVQVRYGLWARMQLWRQRTWLYSRGASEVMVGMGGTHGGPATACGLDDAWSRRHSPTCRAGAGAGSG